MKLFKNNTQSKTNANYKTTFFSLALLIICAAQSLNGQIVIERVHWMKEELQRINLAYAGEKYYVHRKDFNSIELYNADHTFWKTINLPAVNQDMGWAIVNVSQNLFNSDTLIDVAYVYIGLGNWRFRVADESGNVFYSTSGYNEVRVDSTGGLTPKLMLEYDAGWPNFVVSTAVVDIANFSIEKAYSRPAKRINLKYAGEKFYTLDTANFTLKLYNSDHSNWKNISLPAPPEAKNFRVFDVSDDGVNNDSLVEVVYRYERNNFKYTCVVANEAGTAILSVDSISYASVDRKPGLPNILILNSTEYLANALYDNYTRVYTTPNLNLVYEDSTISLMRIKLSRYGEKYAVLKDTAGKMQLLNSDLSKWKQISLGKNNPSDIVAYIYAITDNVITTDTLLEVAYTGPWNYGFKIVDERGIERFSKPEAESYEYSIMPGLANKLITSSIVTGNKSFQIFSLPTYAPLSKAEQKLVQKQPIVSLYPNPVLNKLIIENQDFDDPIQTITIYTLQGVELKNIPKPESNILDVKTLKSGAYLVRVQLASGAESYQRFIKR